MVGCPSPELFHMVTAVVEDWLSLELSIAVYGTGRLRQLLTFLTLLSLICEVDISIDLAGLRLNEVMGRMAGSRQTVRPWGGSVSSPGLSRKYTDAPLSSSTILPLRGFSINTHWLVDRELTDKRSLRF